MVIPPASELQPLVTGHLDVLPFEKLDPATFERLCLTLAGEEGFDRPEHYGLAGSDHGRDVIVLRVSKRRRETWAIQCKRRRSVTIAELLADVRKVAALPSTMRPSGLIFAVSCSLSARARDAVNLEGQSHGLDCQFWAVTELDRLASRHPVIRDTFFNLGRSSSGLTRRELVAKAGALTAAAFEELRGGDFAKSAEVADEAISASAQAGDSLEEIRARATAAHAIFNQLALWRPDSDEAKVLLKSLSGHVQKMEELGAKPSRLLYEKALLALVSRDAAGALSYGRAALAALPNSRDQWRYAEILGVCANAACSLGDAEQVRALATELEEILRRLRVPGARIPTLHTLIWVLCSIDADTTGYLKRFFREIRRSLKKGSLGAPFLIELVGKLAGTFNEHGKIATARDLCKLAYELAEASGSGNFSMSIAVQVAEVSAQLGDRDQALEYLGFATSAVARLRSSSKSTPSSEWITSWAVLQFTRGRVLSRLAGRETNPAQAEELLLSADQALKDAIAFAENHHDQITGDVDVFLADTRWWSGCVVRDLGDLVGSADLFHQVRTSAAAMATPRFAVEVGMQAWFLEAEDLAHAGDLDHASRALDELLADARSTAVPRAKELRDFLDNVLLPIPRWLDSPEGEALAQAALKNGLSPVIATELAPVISWWEAWQREHPAAAIGPEGTMLDFWGRGGFLRMAAAIRARPFSAIAVDATSVDSLRRWARLLCPIFDTVIVKWKGGLGGGFAPVPIPADYFGPGGHAYEITSTVIGDNWRVFAGWGNFIPPEVIQFLSAEALPLMRSGRLVVVPAPLVGCSQSSVGWTDQLLLDGLLGGVVNVVNRSADPRRPGRARVLDLTQVSLPYIEDVQLQDLAMVLEEAKDWVIHLRALLNRSILSPDLRMERWEVIRSLDPDIRSACAELHARYEEMAWAHGWHVANARGSFSALNSAPARPAGTGATDVLRAVVGDRRELGPWIPYWRLQELGGFLHWSAPLDNTPAPPPDSDSQSDIRSSWLHPGTLGWGYRLVAPLLTPRTAD